MAEDKSVKDDESSNEEFKKLPPVEDGEFAKIVELKVVSKKTHPPKPYNEGTLIEDMEKAAKYVEDPRFKKLLKQVSGLGTSATRDAIIETLKRHGYIEKKGRLVKATSKGRGLIEYLPVELYDIARTAMWEAALDIIADGKGKRESFESSIVREIEKQVEALKSSDKEITGVEDTSTTGKERGGGRSSNPPTEKMIGFAESISKSTGIKLPSDYKKNFDACKQFINDNSSKVPASSGGGAGGSTNPPTDKMIGFAESISKSSGVSLPADYKTSFEVCKQFINDNANKTGSSSGSSSENGGGSERPPSEKQISFAQSIANKKKITLPKAILGSGKKLSEWIDKNK